MMNLWRRFLGWQQKASATGSAIAYWTVGRPVYTRRDFKDFADEAYVRNAISHRCIALIASSAASVPIMLSGKDQDVIDEHPVLEILRRPNPVTAGQSFLESVFSYLLISGNAYIEAVGPGAERGRLSKSPTELYSLRPDRMRVVPGQDAIPVGYEYETNGVIVRFAVDVLSGVSPILHIKTFDPIDDWYGMSPIGPAAYAIDRHTEASHFNTALLQNGATPSGALVMKPIKVNDTETVPSESEILSAASKLEERYAGSQNAGRPMVLGGNVEWSTFGMTMEQLQLNESKLDAARDVCIAFGVPIELLLPGQSTYNNKAEAKLAFYEETVLPLSERVIDHLNSWLLPMYGEDRAYSLSPDLDQIEALAPRRAHLQEETLKLYQGGVITLDEARTTLQWGEADDAVRAELVAPKQAEAALNRARAFQVDVNSGLFDEDELRDARADQLELHGTYPEAARLKKEPEPVEQVDFEDPDAGIGPNTAADAGDDDGYE